MNLSRIARQALLATLLAAGYTEASAVMAYPGRMTHTNPDGTTVEFFKRGDEWCNFTTTTDGYLITKTDDGYFRYANVVDGEAVATPYAVTDIESRPAEVKAMLASMDTHSMIEQLRERRELLQTGPSRSASSGTSEKTTSFPTLGSPRVLVILVDFPDYKFSHSKSQFQDWLTKKGYNYDNGTGRASGSVLDYYTATSDGQFTPQFEVVGPYTASQNRAYYGYKSNPSMNRVPTLATEACKSLSADGTVDFSNYDANNDGVVDIVYLVFAGPGSADSNDDDAIWPHKWDVGVAGTRPVLNGKRVQLYGCSPELSYGRYFTAIGTFSHEFGHVLGLGDHYDTDYCGNRTPEDWDIMASGSYNNNGQTPPLFSAYERHVMGWIKPEIITDRNNYTMRAATNGGYNDAYIVPTTKDNEYFVLENRQQSGWDRYLPHHGMLIWHIDYNSTVWSNNTINCNSHQYVDIEEAGGASNTDETATPFPGSTKNRSFTDDTTPSMRMWSGARLDSPITDITEASDGVISFSFKGGKAVESRLELLDPVVTYNQATISWKPLDGVSQYYVTITNTTSGAKVTDNVEVTATSYTVTALDSNTKYSYTVANYENYVWAEAHGEFTTAVTPLNMRAPENIVTTEVGDRFFTAQWDEVELATRYTVSLYTGTVGGPTTVTEGFDNQTLLPGWTTSSTDFYSTAGYYGTTAPSIKLADGDYVMSKYYDANITKLQVTQRRVGSVNGTITIYGRQSTSSQWIELDNKTVSSSKSRTNVTIDPTEAIHQIMITETASDATIMIDDIILSLDSSIELTPVDGFTAIDTGAETIYTVKGLQPSTTYYYTVRAHNDTDDSLESAPKEVTTDAITPLSMRVPENIVTTEVGDKYFTAQWDEVELATRYTVSLYTGTIGGETTETENFDNESLLPGWTSSSNEFITTTGYYGSSAPSIRLNSNDYVMSKVYDANISNVQILHRRIGSVNGALSVFGRTSASDDWTELDKKTVSSSKARTNVSIAPENAIHQIKIIQSVDNASIIADDIVLTLDSSTELVPVDNMTSLDAGGETTYTVKGLQPSTTYYYTIRAHNDTEDSLESAPIEVTTDVATGIDNVIADSNAAVSVSNLTVTVSTDIDAVVGIYTPTGLGVILPVKLEAGATAAFQLPSEGIYIVRVGKKSYKIVAD